MAVSGSNSRSGSVPCHSLHLPAVQKEDLQHHRYTHILRHAVVLLSGSFMWYQSSHGSRINGFVLWFTIVMMNIPQISFFIYLIYKAYKGIRKGVVVWRLRRKTNGAPRGERSSEERDLELLTDSFHYRIDYAAVAGLCK